MAEILELEGDNKLLRTLLSHFGKLLVVVFYAEGNQASMQLKDNLVATIPLFGMFPNVKYLAVKAEKCPQTLKKFNVEYTPTVLFTQTDKKELKRFETDDVGSIFDSMAE